MLRLSGKPGGAHRFRKTALPSQTAPPSHQMPAHPGCRHGQQVACRAPSKLSSTLGAQQVAVQSGCEPLQRRWKGGHQSSGGDAAAGRGW